MNECDTHISLNINSSHFDEWITRIHMYNGLQVEVYILEDSVVVTAIPFRVRLAISSGRELICRSLVG